MRGLIAMQAIPGLDSLLPVTTGRLPVAHIVAGQKPFVAFGNVLLSDLDNEIRRNGRA